MSQKAQSQTPSIDEVALLDQFLQDAALQGLTERTIQTYKSTLQIYLDWLDDDPLSIDRRDLKGYLHYIRTERRGRGGKKGLSDNAVKNHFSAINSFYKFLKYERYIQENLVPEFRERYLDTSRGGDTGSSRQLISVEEMAMLVHGTLNVRDRAIIVLLAKTGVRRNELIQIDVDHVDWDEQSIELRPTAKRTNTLVFFDGECARVLERWLRARDEEEPETDALFTNQEGERLKRHGVYSVVTKHAEAVGLHDPDSSDLQDRFTPHCCRHWFTTHLRRSGMKREFIQELRGDTRGDAIDIYDHIDEEELREAYLAHIPTLGI